MVYGGSKTITQMKKIQKFHPGRYYTSTNKNWFELIDRKDGQLTFRVRKAKARSESWKQVATSTFKADDKGAFETVRFNDGTILRADSRSYPVPGAAPDANTAA